MISESPAERQDQSDEQREDFPPDRTFKEGCDRLSTTTTFGELHLLGGPWTVVHNGPTFSLSTSDRNIRVSFSSSPSIAAALRYIAEQMDAALAKASPAKEAGHV